MLGATGPIKCEIRWEPNWLGWVVYVYREVYYDRTIFIHHGPNGELIETEHKNGEEVPTSLIFMRDNQYHILEVLREKLNEIFGPKLAVGAEGRIEAMRSHILDLQRLLKIDESQYGNQIRLSRE